MSLQLKWARVVFTGRLALVTPSQASEMVASHEGVVQRHVTRMTTIVVVGGFGWPVLPSGAVSRSVERAEELNRKGHRIAIVPERAFLAAAGRLTPAQTLWREAHRGGQGAGGGGFSAGEVCELLEIDPQRLRRWRQLGLVDAHGERYDFRDVVSLRTLCELLRRGVPLETIGRAVHKLARYLPGTQRPLAQLDILAADPWQLLIRSGDALATVEGQLVFDFEKSPEDRRLDPIALDAAGHSAQQWFDLGQSHEDAGRVGEAMRAYERAVAADPDHALAHFNLGALHHEQADHGAAERHYRAALKADEGHALAWYNLADVLEQREDGTGAVACLERAVACDPGHADAIYNLAALLEDLDRPREARQYWRRYLAFDPASPWAQTAREHLAER